MPQQLSGIPVEVGIGIKLYQLTEVNPTKNILEVSGMITATFNNTYLSWDSDNYGNVSKINQPQSRSWLPNFRLDKAAEKQIFQANDKILLFNDGKVILSVTENFKVICKFDVYLFPFDSTGCVMAFDFGDISKNELKFTKLSLKSSLLKHFEQHSEWEVTEAADEVTEKLWWILSSQSENLSVYEVKLLLKRRPESYITFIILPLVILVVLSWMTFILPLKSGERVGLGVTILLTYTIFQQLLYNSLPKSDVLPAIGFLICVFEGLSAGSLLVTIVILRFYHLADSPTSIRASHWVARALLCGTKSKIDPTRMCEQGRNSDDIAKETFKKFAHLLDKVFLILFIIMYTVVTVYTACIWIQ